MPPEATLNQLKAKTPSGHLPSSYGVYFKNTLVALCHALEDHILQNGQKNGQKNASKHSGTPPLVLVTFQMGKWYLQEADRYESIAACSDRVAIAAVADSGFDSHPTSERPNVDLVHLDPEDSLTSEWNLIILAPDYASMVLCHELSSDDYRADAVPSVDMERKFYGMWTFERSLVEQAAEILIERMRPYSESLADDLLTRHSQIKQHISPNPADLSDVVSRIVNYLQSSQQQLVTVSRQSRELWELEGQALRLSRNLTANKLQAFLRMAQRVDDRDPANPMASMRVAALAETVGQVLDLPTIKLRRLRLAGLLFRIGLAEAPIEVFLQTADQMEENSLVFWRDRAQLGAQLLSSMPELTAVSDIVAHQLEHWDGSGPPDGLKGEEIPIESRILGLVAYFQELTEARGDRPALPLAEAFEVCQGKSGKRFDPDILEALGTVVRLSEIGMMQLPDRPSQLPAVWLEETRDTAASEVAS